MTHDGDRGCSGTRNGARPPVWPAEAPVETIGAQPFAPVRGGAALRPRKLSGPARPSPVC